jgi:penicillin-binding protein 2
MKALRDVEADLYRFRARVLAATVLVGLAFALLLVRLGYLQWWRYDDLYEQAESNRTAVVPIVPNRGIIMDRNGVVLANNYSAYTLEITPSKLTQPLEQVIDQLAEVIEVQPRDRRRFKKLREESRSFESVPLRTRLTDQEVARFTAQQFRFPGVEIRARLFRNYPMGDLASHVIGYIGRINQAEKERLEDSDDEANYRGTDYIGKLGIEQRYERELHGTTGVHEMETSAGGRAVRRLSSLAAVPGHTVVLSIDIRLQKLVEDLYGQRRGALVAMDPNTGEVLAFVSKPTFDPNLFVEGIEKIGRRSTTHRTSHCSTGPCVAPIRLDRHTSPSWRWPRSRLANAPRNRCFPTPDISCLATTAFVMTRRAGTGWWTCTDRLWSRATPTTTCWRGTWASISCMSR